METDKNSSFEDKYLLVAKADNVKHISSLLRAVNFKDVSFNINTLIKNNSENYLAIFINIFISLLIFNTFLNQQLETFEY